MAGLSPARSESFLQTTGTKEIVMKLVRYGAPGREKPGMIDAEGRIRDLSKIVPDIAGDALSSKSLAKLRKLKPEKPALGPGKKPLGPWRGKVRNFHPMGFKLPQPPPKTGKPVTKGAIIFK